METTTQPLKGIEILRAMRERKKRIQQEAVEEYRNNPKVRAIFDELKKKNGGKK